MGVAETSLTQLRLAALIGLLAGAPLGCAITPAEQEAIRQAWQSRDAERAAECRRMGGWWKAGVGCKIMGDG